MEESIKFVKYYLRRSWNGDIESKVDNLERAIDTLLDVVIAQEKRIAKLEESVNGRT